ncbi:DNA glycosylase AlkZ-like family protein [Streptomyces roseoverticillatus]|uniref:Crosslink repair DNA glycosylase YcaQ family protein n=1 Tax=Streptomyces roseoverticillatus TaxID=66429 RepID=A0ABV3IM52_9ACTN
MKTVQEVADALIGLHATDPATVFLAAAARIHAPTTAAIDAALYDTGDLARIRCIRRTMFVLPASLALAARAVTVKDAQRKLCQELGWEAARYAAVQESVLATLAARGQATAAELAVDVPALREQIVTFPGKSYESRRRAGAPVLGALAAEGRSRRSRPADSWTSAQFRWAPATPLPRLPAAEAKTELARRYVSAFGPVTAGDLKWWTGWTLTDTRKALAATGAQEVALDEGTDRPPPPGRPRPWGPYRHPHRGRSPDRLPRQNPCHPLLPHPTGTPAVFRASHKRLTGSAGCGAEGCPTF